MSLGVKRKESIKQLPAMAGLMRCICPVEIFTTFDKKVLEKHISRYQSLVGKEEFPTIVLYDMEDANSFHKKHVVCCNNPYRGEVKGWIIPKTEDDFIDICGRLSKKFRVPYMVTEASLWLQSIYYSDSVALWEGTVPNRINIGSPEWVAQEYKVSMEVACLLVSYCGIFSLTNFANIAQALHG